MFSLSDTSRRNRAGVDQRLIEISDRAIQITKVDFGHGPYSGRRSQADQQHLHAIGASPNCDGVEKRSPHQDGRALDVTAYVDGNATWEHKYYAMIAVAFLTAANELGYRIRWGGMFLHGAVHDGVPYGWDCPHFELE